MLGAYTLSVDIIAEAETTSLEEFQKQVSSCLSHLDALKGSFDRSPCRVTYYPPNESPDNSDNVFWSLRAVVLISVGKQRAKYLLGLYEALGLLIRFELPHLAVQYEIAEFHFS